MVVMEHVLVMQQDSKELLVRLPTVAMDIRPVLTLLSMEEASLEL